MGRKRPPRTSLRTSLDSITLFGSKQSLQWSDFFLFHLWAMGPSCDLQLWKGLLRHLRGQIPESEGQERRHRGTSAPRAPLHGPALLPKLAKICVLQGP